MPSVNLKVIFGEKEFDAPVIFKFKKHFQIKGDQLFCAEFDPPLTVQGTELKFVNFTDFTFQGFGFTLYAPDDFYYNFQDSDERFVMKIIEHVPFPMINEWNPVLTSDDEPIYSNIFHKSPYDMEYKLLFLTTIQCNWTDMKEIIESTFKSSNLGSFGKSLGILTKLGELPNLIPIDEFFKDKYGFRFAKKINCIVLSSFQEFALTYKSRVVSSKNVPGIPRSLIERLAKQHYHRNREFDRIQKQMLRILINGGIFVDIFRKRPNLIINTLQLKNGQELATFFKTSDFERTVLQLGSVRVSKVEIDSYNVLLGEIFEGMKDHLYHPLDESSLRSIFWDQFIQKLFRNGLEKKPKNFILRSEWRTREQFSHLEDRKVDFVALIKPDEMFHTILQVEVGADCFDYNHPHKDTAKLLGNLAQSCISMALDLASKGKSPTIARCYGLLIGETRVQGVVAHPVIRKVGAYYEIHANITSHPHWIFDMLNKSPKRNCSLPCCAPPPKDFKLSEMERLEEGEIDPNNFPVETYASTRDINLQSDTDQKETTSPTKKSGSLLSEGANWNDVDRLNNFIKIIKGRIDLILAEKQSSEWKKYKFKGSRSFGANFGSSGSNSNKTPKKEAITNAFASKNIRVSDSPLSNKKQRSFCIRKSSRLELEIMIKLSAMPNIFPVLLAYKIEDEKIIYEIESLEPLEEAGYVSSILHQIHPDDSLFASICFAVQTLYGLHVLHESFNIVHSDISPTNIMYSSIHKCWKVIDFDQSLSLEKSVKRSRIAGTMDYISPESETSGIFNFESDIFSLGRVMADFLLPVLMQQILLAGDDDGEDDEETLPIKVKESFYKFSNLVYEMASPNPMQRPSIKILLKQLFGLLQEYVFDEDNPIFLAVKLIIQDTDFKSKISSFPDSNEFKKIKTSDRIE